jgi:hypothetical protein
LFLATRGHAYGNYLQMLSASRHGEKPTVISTVFWLSVNSKFFILLIADVGKHRILRKCS